MTREDQEAIDQIRDLIADRARLELFAEHAIAVLLGAGNERGSVYLSPEQVAQLVGLGKTALGIDDLDAVAAQRRAPAPVVDAEPRPFPSFVINLGPAQRGI